MDKDAEDILTAMRSRLYGHNDNNAATTTTTTTTNNNNNNNNRTSTQTNHVQSVISTGANNNNNNEEEGDGDDDDDDAASSSFFMTEVTPRKKAAALAAASAASNQNHNHNNHNDYGEVAGTVTGTGTGIGGLDVGMRSGDGVDDGLAGGGGFTDPHPLPPFARHALGQRLHASTSHTLLHNSRHIQNSHNPHPQHQRSTQSSHTHRENVFSQLDAVPLRYRRDILSDGPPGPAGNTFPRASPVSLQRPLHGTFPLPGASQAPGAGGGGGGGGGGVDSQKRELDRLRENHSAAFR